MKKLISMVLCIAIIMVNVVVMAETTEVEGLHEKLSALILENNFTDEQIADMDRQYVEYFNELWPGQLEGYKALGRMETNSDEEEYEYRLNQARPDFSYGIKTTLLSIAPNYAKQYADANSFDYLFSENEFWLVLSDESENMAGYDLHGNKIKSMQETFNISYSDIMVHSENIEIIKDEEYIKNLLLEKNETKVEDIKVFALSRTIPFLYINCGKTEYLISLHVGTEWAKYMKPFEQYKLYSVKEVLQEVSKGSASMRKEKPTYETEALSLQEDGLLLGNENGLDLLKPLTRIEAATMLLRAMGESTESEAQMQTFADVPLTHWGYGAAENAYALGLIKGIGDDLFAPEDMVTGPQFATMILRAGNHAEFNWEEALDIMINEGIITSENAATMDFFTRGDMAKIIYEAIEKGLF